jgi:hypothetical protein
VSKPSLFYDVTDWFRPFFLESGQQSEPSSSSGQTVKPKSLPLLVLILKKAKKPIFSVLFGKKMSFFH